jgi:hypothetical protein
MRNIIFLVLFLVLNLNFAWAVSLSDILINPDEFDGKLVEIEAEVIGEQLVNKKGGWINVSVGGYNIGIFSSDPKVYDQIKHWGSYKEKGDLVRIKGIFYRNCSLHQISDIHLESLNIVKSGYENKEAVTKYKKWTGIFSSILCSIVTAIYFIKRKYARTT